jgi:ribosome biogenesis protein UTP30
MTIEDTVKQYLEYLKKEDEDKKELFDDARKGSVQFSLNKIPNLQNDKRVLCKLPNSLNPADKELNICLIVKDIDPKNRDYDNTVRKYKEIINAAGLSNIITQVMPIKQLKLEFRHFEAKRKLCTSFDMFLSDKCLHEILFNGSKLGKEFKKRKRMPIEIDLEEDNLKESVDNVLHATFITLTGKGPILDVNTFLSTHTPKQVCQNIAAVKSELIKQLPGGEGNIKSIYLKSTDRLAVPIYVNTPESVKDVKIENNMNPIKIKKAKKLSGKRLKRKHIQDAKKLKREAQAAKASSERQLLVEGNKEKVEKVEKKVVKKDAVPMVGKKAISKPDKPAAKAKAKAVTKAKSVKIIK